MANNNVLVSYHPTFLQPTKGSWKDDANFVALNVGTDAYVTEREMNELQWIRTEVAAKTLREITKSGILTIDESSNLSKCFKIINNNETNLNSFDMPPFKSVINGYLNHHENFKLNSIEKNLHVRLPNPPVGGYRYDFVFLEMWFMELKENDTVRKFGYTENDHMGYTILDERVNDETSRRIQCQWTISHYEDYDGLCENGFLDPDGNPNPNIHPLAQTGYRAVDYYYEKSAWDEHLYVAGEGLVQNQKIKTLDGYVYAIPLFSIFRINNSGYNEQYNPLGGLDYVDKNTVADRPDGKFSNIIYDDQVIDLRHLAPISEKQYNKIYTTLTEYYTDAQMIKNKMHRVTNDLENLHNVIRNLGYEIPQLYDKEIYGVEMFGQYGQTAGAMLDETDEDKKVIYRKRKYYVGHKLEVMDYCVIPTLIDYDWEKKGKIGDLFIKKQQTRFNVYNTGARNIKMNLEAIAVDNEVVMMGEGQFSGMDGTFITMPFKLDDDRYFVHICPLENTNGRNGEIFVKMVDDQIIVYNTGLTTNRQSAVVSTTDNKFQWVVIDMYANVWKNINYVNVTLAGQNGVKVSSKEFGEIYRLSLGTPILTTSSSVEEGSVGDIYADIDCDDIFTVYNTGSEGATVQCLIFNEILYDEYYDTVNVDMDILLPNIVVREKK